MKRPPFSLVFQRLTVVWVSSLRRKFSLGFNRTKKRRQNVSFLGLQKQNTTDWFKQQNWKSKIKVSAGLGSPESLLLGLQMSACLAFLHGLSSVYTCTVSLCVTKFPLLIKKYIGVGCSSVTSFYLSHLF
jgi:hypothetical protein